MREARRVPLEQIGDRKRELEARDAEGEGLSRRFRRTGHVIGDTGRLTTKVQPIDNQ